MEILLIKDGGILKPANPEAEKKLSKVSDGAYFFKMLSTDTRTVKQNNAMHLWFRQIAELLNKHNIPLIHGSGDNVTLFKIDIDFTPELVKNTVARMAVKYATDGRTEKTSQMTKKEFDDFINVVTLWLGRLGIEAPPFPSRELWRDVT